MEAVKMEGGRRVKESIKAVVNAGIPVIGHIGLTPQTQSALGGFRVQAKTADAAQQLLDLACGCNVATVVYYSQSRAKKTLRIFSYLE